MRRRDWLTAAASGALMAVVGCGRPALPATAKVLGRVTLDGTPLAKGVVMFYPDRAKGTVGRMAVAPIGSDGRFELSSFKPGDGAIIGHHLVAVVCETDPPTMEQTKMQPPPVVRSLIPEKYTRPESSGLKFEVKTGAANEFLLELRRHSAEKGG